MFESIFEGVEAEGSWEAAVKPLRIGHTLPVPAGLQPPKVGRLLVKVLLGEEEPQFFLLQIAFKDFRLNGSRGIHSSDRQYSVAWTLIQRAMSAGNSSEPAPRSAVPHTQPHPALIVVSTDRLIGPTGQNPYQGQSH